MSDPLPPAGAVCVSVALGDLDGDGRSDRAVAWGDPAPRPVEGGQRPWHLAVVTAAGRTASTLVSTPFYELALRAIVDVNGDGRGQVLVRVDRGASVERWSAFALIDGMVRQIEAGDRVPFELGMYGSVMHGNRFQCVRDASGARLLSVMGFGSRYERPGDYGSLVYDWTARNYRIRGASAVAVGSATGTITQAAMSDPTSDFNRTWPSPWDPDAKGQCGADVRGY